MKRLLAVVLLVGIAGATGAAELKVVPGTATGYLKLDGQKYPIKYAYAIGLPTEYWLVLTDIAVPNESFQGPVKLKAITVDGKTHGLMMTIDAKGKPDPITILQAEAVTANLDWQTFELAKIGKDALEGKTKTSGPHKGAEKTYEYEISFKAPVASPTK